MARAIVRHTIREFCDDAKPRRRVVVGMPQQRADLPAADTAELGETFDADAHLIALEWMRRGYRVHWVNRSFFMVRPFNVAIGYWGSASSFTYSPGVAVSFRKDLMRRLLTRAKLAVPEGRVFRKMRSLAKARAVAMSMGTVAVKPVDGEGGIGLTTAVGNDADLEYAWRQAHASTSHGVIVERHCDGLVVRFLVVGDRCLAVHHRPPGTADLSTAVHPSYKDVAVRAVRAISGLDVATVDIISRGFEDVIDESSYAILDIDSTPSIRGYHLPGTAHDVAKAIVDYHLSRVSV